MSDLSSAITLFETIFLYSSFLSTFLITQVIIIVTSLLILTRETNEWKQLGFPVSLGWLAFGLPVSSIILAGTGLVLAIDGLSIPIVQRGLRSVKGYITDVAKFEKEVYEVGGTRKFRELKRRDKIEAKQQAKIDKVLSKINISDKITGLSRTQLEKARKEAEFRGDIKLSSRMQEEWEKSETDREVGLWNEQKRLARAEVLKEGFKKKFKQPTSDLEGSRKARLWEIGAIKRIMESTGASKEKAYDILYSDDSGVWSELKREVKRGRLKGE